LIKKQKNGLTVFEFPNIAAFSGVQHGVFSRRGGCSRGAYSSLNVGFGIGDPEDAVADNRKRISACFKGDQFVFAQQVHGKTVLPIYHGSGCRDKRIFCDAGAGDAMITNVPGINLVIQIADCQAVMIYDPENHAIANVHAGWRGNVHNILGHTLSAMKDRFNSAAADLRVGISPSLGPCCAEFLNYKKEFPAAYWRFKDDAHHFDLWALSCDQLCDQGVSAQNIFVSGLCTRCNSKTFFSYRAEKETGRFAAVIGLI
jgi:YfiH family protein